MKKIAEYKGHLKPWVPVICALSLAGCSGRQIGRVIAGAGHHSGEWWWDDFSLENRAGACAGLANYVLKLWKIQAQPDARQAVASLILDCRKVGMRNWLAFYRQKYLTDMPLGSDYG